MKLVDSTKCLGVQVDQILNWNQYASNTCNKESKGMGILYYAKHILSLGTTQSMHKSLVEPLFRYSMRVWVCCGTTTLDELQRLQNRATRIVRICQYDAPSLSLIKGLAWSTIKELIEIEIARGFSSP